MKKYLIVVILFFQLLRLNAQEKKIFSFFKPKNQEQIDQLTKQNENLKRNLAEARREWQKIREVLLSQDSIFEEKLKLQEKAISDANECKIELEKVQNTLKDSTSSLILIIDSLKKNGATTNESEKKEIIDKIIGLLKNYPKNQYKILNENANLKIQLSDSLIFTNYYQISATGSFILQKLIAYFQSSSALYFGIHAYPDETTKPIYYHKIAQAKLQTLHYYALAYKLPYGKTILHAHPKSFFANYVRSPVIIEFHYQ